jgi:Fur family transcriptional regulator, ferric uptake regulator
MPAKKLESERELFYEYLRQNGLKKTRQKDLILDTFLANEGHMSVEDIYALVKKKDKRVGIVTVFRTLKSLTACGIAKEISLGDGLTRFEHCYRHPLHHHIICTQCLRVIEFLSPELERVQQGVVTKYRFQPVQQRIQIYGVCEDCRELRSAPEGPKADTGKVFARDALRMALAMQKQGYEFYRSAAASNQDPSGRAAFEIVAREEESHAMQLESELEMLHRHEKGLENAPVFLHFDSYELQQLIPCLPSDLGGAELRLDARRALEIAMQLEMRAAGFFKEYAEKFGETEGKRIFERIAEQQLQHYAAISGRAEALLLSSA